MNAAARPFAVHTPAVDAAAFKAGMRALASGVTVITSCADGRLNGMTATAVCSVSASPPRLLAVVNREAASHGLIERGAAFAVNILAHDQDHVAARFAQRLERPFEGLAYAQGETGCALLDRAAASLECRLHERHDAGTHTIFIGEVIAVRAAEAEPLLYFSGAYRRLAPHAHG
ncbi:flavin reductase family protein [Xanthobacter tagetidis]|jgi:flavin reductase|uniref:Flavin reductase n=1 Tax=Xanthobacter tagetidis TaxID=60216 RepID=A0A3L7A5F5_9HYPH|nr:flavin reductase family protein [Xanthobacter tagetidis]MBB6310065.1 flavin reductase [Xanthobacter tagetidis]RLP75168.1 flavin reductase [Xanthobacter tagetidis]